MVVSDAEGEETLEIHSTDGFAKTTRLGGLGIGRVIEMRVDPKADQVALSNHRNELLLVDLKSRKTRVLDKSAWAQIAGFDWSMDCVQLRAEPAHVGDPRVRGENGEGASGHPARVAGCFAVV